MAGAVWRDPEHVQDWVGELSRSDPVVVFCVYGFHVGCQTAGALRRRDSTRCTLKGGHSAGKRLEGR